MDSKSSIISLTEHLLHILDDVTPYSFKLLDFNVIHNPRCDGKHVGGDALLLNNNYTITSQIRISMTLCSVLLVKFKISHSQIITLLTIYRPTNNNRILFLKELSVLIHQYISPYHSW